MVGERGDGRKVCELERRRKKRCPCCVTFVTAAGLAGLLY